MKFVFLCILLIIATVTSDVENSTYELKLLLKTEVEFARKLREYSGLIHNQKLSEYIKANYPDGHALFDADQVSDVELEKYVSNPINALSVIKRTGFGLVDLVDVMETEGDHETLRKELVDMVSNNMTKPRDLIDATESFTLLQETYELLSEDLAEGVIRLNGTDDNGQPLPVVKTDIKLSHEDLQNIGISACNRQWFDSCTKWLELAIKRWPGDKTSEGYKSALRSLQMARTVHDKTLEARGPLGKGKLKHRTFLLPFDEKLRKKKKYKKVRSLASKMTQFERSFLPLFESAPSPITVTARDNFHSMCKIGKSGWRSPEMEAKFKCRYEDHGDVYLRLGPFKLEELNDQPFVVIFHGFFNDEETDYIKDQVSNKMRRSSMGSSSVTKKAPDNVRTSKQSWVEDKFFRFPVTEDYKGADRNGSFFLAEDMTSEGVPHYVGEASQKYMRIFLPKLFKITQRIGRATRTTLNYPFSAESYQVANYGLGGQYATHFDPVNFWRLPQNIKPESHFYYKSKGDRLATFMGYLSDVELGGGTVFPLLGLRSQAVRGDAIFWLNLHSDGSTDPLTLHGGCPVLVGSKWITNKWIAHHDQGLLSYPCGLRPLERYPAFDDWRGF